MKGLCILALVLCFFSCSSDEVITEEEKDESRSFYMGFTAFPYDLTIEAQLDTYKQVAVQSDIFLVHLDHGVPWDEALNNFPFPSEVQNTLEGTKTGLAPNTKILLTATPAGQDRKTLSGFWNNNDSHQPLSSFWENKKFDDDEVVTAYINYCKRIIDEVNPDYFAYGIETNASFKKDETAFTQFLRLADTLYKRLKKDYPAIPIFLTLQDRSFDNTHEELLATSKSLLQYSDYIVMSTYPFLDYQNLQRDANPELFDDNWLADFRNLDISKPFAISETGFCAEDLVIPNLGVNVKASEKWQNDFMIKLLNSANDLDAEFLAWFVFRDYDYLYDKTPNPPDILSVWRDNGLLNGSGMPRPSFQTWKDWKSYEKN